MIASLRARHRATFAVLALLLPAAFVAAVVGRGEAPVNRSLPAELFEHDASDVVRRELSRDARGMRSFELLRENDGRSAVVSQVSGEPAPDVLVYALARDGAFEPLPDDTVLLGALSGAASRFELPASATRIVLYSLAHGEVLAGFDLGPN